MELNGAAQIEGTATQLGRKLKKFNFKVTEQASLLTITLQSGFLVSVVL
jgi:hypothetical protein